MVATRFKQAMTLEEIYRFFEHPPVTYLNRELAVCYLLDCLLKKDCYCTELLEQLNLNSSRYRLSLKIQYEALNFLERSKMIRSYWRQQPGRGRPRKMYRLQSDDREQAEALARLWGNYFQDDYERGFNDGMRYWIRFSSASCLTNPIDGLPSFLASEPCTSNTGSGAYFYNASNMGRFSTFSSLSCSSESKPD